MAGAVREGESLRELGAICRTLREQAGVSLGDMARIVHRDASSLSRFERGHSRPRDLEQLVESYRGLARGPQRRRQTHGKPRAWVLAYLGVTMLALIAALSLSGDALTDAQIVRGWCVVSGGALVIAGLAGAVRRSGLRERLAAASYSGALATIVATCLTRWELHANAGLAAVALPAVVLSVFAYALRAGPGD